MGTIQGQASIAERALHDTEGVCFKPVKNADGAILNG